MARRVLPLKDTQIKAAKKRDKDYKLFDGGGLYLLVTKGGGKLWYLKYRINGKEKKIALGAYPSITIKDARAKREEYKNMIANGIDPSEEKKALKEEAKQQEREYQNTLYKVTLKWLESYKGQVTDNYHTKVTNTLNNHVFSKYLLPDRSTLNLKDTPINEISRLDIITLLEQIKAKGITDTPRRVAMLLNKVYKYAVTHELTPHNIMADIELTVILGKHTKKHYPTFTKTEDIRGLLHNIDAYTGDYGTKMALKILPYLFVRSYNIRHMEWQEISFKNQEWRIPAEKMKTKTEFILPLPHQVITLLEEIKATSTNTQYVFPSYRGDGYPMSDNTLLSALRRMGYTKEEFVPHSFRAMFSTIAYEWANRKDGHGYTGEVIEACLAHKEPNKVKEAYNRSSYKEAMRGLMQWYADYLEGVKRG